MGALRGRGVVAAVLLGAAACAATPGIAGPAPVGEVADAGEDAAAGAIVVGGDRFRLTIDPGRGGEISSITQAGQAVLAGGRTFPELVVREGERTFELARASGTRVDAIAGDATVSRYRATATPRAADGSPSAWEATLDYEIYPDGAVFVGFELRLATGSSQPSDVSVSLGVDETAPLHRASSFASSALPTARFASGTRAGGGFTNELHALVEDGTPLAGASRFELADGTFTWHLADGAPVLAAPITYRNRIALALGATPADGIRTRLVGSRTYHWVGMDSWQRAGAAWYPTDAEIDAMADRRANVLVLHQLWMAQGGSNGDPHADYTAARDHDALVHAIAHAHERGLAVALYTRGIERYGIDSNFFETYLTRDRDGLYVDWNGPNAVVDHEHNHASAGAFDPHFSPGGTYLPAHDYFLYLRRLRAIVGANGFLIGHQGSLNAGVFPNLDLDAFLPGEAPTDRQMLSDVVEASYRGMTGAGLATPWTVDAPDTFTSREGVAKMAAWGMFPEVPLGIYGFPLDPAAPANEYALAYWRLLAAGNAEASTLFNTPSSPIVAATSSSAQIACVVYRRPEPGAFSVIAANLGPGAASATLTLAPDVLGLEGTYRLRRIDPATGALADPTDTARTIDTGTMAGWDLAGWTLTRD